MKQIRAGSVGYFSPLGNLPHDLAQDRPGHVRWAEEEGLFHIETLLDSHKDVRDAEKAPIPHTLIGRTISSGIVVTGVQRRTITHRSARQRVSTVLYRATTLMHGLDPCLITKAGVTEVSVRIPGITDWAGISALKESHTSDENGRAMSYSIEARAPEEVVLVLSKGRELVLSAHWESSGPDDNRVIFAPIELSCRSSRPKEYYDLREPLLRIQELVSLAYQGTIAADGGTVGLIAPDSQSRRTELWDSSLMWRRPGTTAPNSMTEFPLFSLWHIGDAPGLRRWVKIWEKYGQAVRPLVDSFRIGEPSAPVRLMEIAAGIEHWVARHRRYTKWAQEKFTPYALAKQVGHEFGAFVGDPHAWAELFWNHYLDVKHFRTTKASAYEDDHAASLLAESGRVLLMCAVLNRVGNSKNPSRSVLQSHRTHSLSRRIKELVSSSTPRRESR